MCRKTARFCGRTSACRLTHPKATQLQLSGHTALYASSQSHTQGENKCTTDRRSVFSAPDPRKVATEVFREGCIVAKSGQGGDTREREPRRVRASALPGSCGRAPAAERPGSIRDGQPNQVAMRCGRAQGLRIR